jgi:hypothetical protein
LLLSFLGDAFASSPATGLAKFAGEAAPTYYLVHAARAAVRGHAPAAGAMLRWSNGAPDGADRRRCRSDAVREFAERDTYTLSRWFAVADLVVTAAYVVHERVASCGHA